MSNIVKVLICFGVFQSVFAAPPEPPKGYEWKLVERFSDEFDEDKLDKSKWYGCSPGWVGRPPALFIHDAVTVSNGLMRIRARMLDKPTTRGKDKFTIGSGAVVSLYDDAYYGYYECRMKASSVSMSSTFWLCNKDGNNKHWHELDIIETIGAPKIASGFNQSMHYNTHYWVGMEDYARGGKVDISPPSNKDFHIYGAWWVDPNTVHFYHNDKLAETIRPVSKFSDTPFDRPMRVQMVSETYDWEDPPTPSELNDHEKSTVLYDWVRCYELVPDAETRAKMELKEQAKEIYGKAREWKSVNGKSSITATLVKVKLGRAFLQKEDGSEILVPIDKLCEKDQELIKLAAEHVESGN